ncbi:MAG: hypothetical protein R3C24_13615 [Cyanobacteriota/Melainabacteria group bacterium]
MINLVWLWTLQQQHPADIWRVALRLDKKRAGTKANIIAVNMETLIP